MKKQVYVVMDWEQNEIVGVFGSNESARKALSEYIADDTWSISETMDKWDYSNREDFLQDVILSDDFDWDLGMSIILTDYED